MKNQKVENGGLGTWLQQNVTKGTAPSTVQTVDAATNRLNGAGFGYDSNGNMTGWSTPSGSVTASYDIENRMTQIVTPSVTETYKYGPGNLRVKKSQGGTWTYTVYGQGGEALGTFTGCSVGGVSFLCEAKLRVYFGGRLVLNGWTGVKPDRLGSPDGTHGRVYPYGEVSGSVSVDQDETFTTYKRDVGTGLDYAQNRYYASAWGRFTTADPYRASGGAANPGSWNRYAYVENDPVGFTDPAGLQMMAFDVVNQTCFYVMGQLDSCAMMTTTYWLQSFSGGGGGGGAVEMTGWSGGAGGVGSGSESDKKEEAVPAQDESQKKEWTCTGDALINFGLGFVPGYNAAKFVVAAAGFNVTPIQWYFGTKPLPGEISPNALTSPAAAASGYYLVKESQYIAAGGAGVSERLADLAGRAGFAARSAAAQARTVGALGALTAMKNAATTAGLLANLLNAGSAAIDIYKCWHP